MIFPKEADPTEPWLETTEAKIWARGSLFAEPPYKLHSEERDRVIEEIRNDTNLIEEICVQSFWNLSNHEGDDDAAQVLHIQALRKRIEMNAALIAPWRLLPTELLSLIFEYMRDTSEITRTPIGHHVSQVCRRWREIALVTPKCWSDIHIADAGIAIPLLETWLDRSKTLPLRISFIEASHRQATRIRPLLKQVHRIEFLTFSTRVRFQSHLFGDFGIDNDYTSAPTLPKLLDGATRLTHLVLPYGLFRGSRFRSLQVYLPSLRSVNGIESWELRSLRPTEPSVLRHLAIQDPESKCEFLSLLRQCMRVAPELETLDLTNWSVVINESTFSTTSTPVLPTLKKLFLPKHSKILHALDRQQQVFPNLTVVSLFTAELNGHVNIPTMPTIVTLNFRTNKGIKATEPNPYIPWIQKCPNLRVLILESTMWIHKTILPTLLQDLYNNYFISEFSWENMDQSRLYAWHHSWCICIAKKNELRLYEHLLADIRPTVWIDGHEYPYSINHSWLELEAKISVVGGHVMDLVDDTEEMW